MQGELFHNLNGQFVLPLHIVFRRLLAPRCSESFGWRERCSPSSWGPSRSPAATTLPATGTTSWKVNSARQSCYSDAGILRLMKGLTSMVSIFCDVSSADKGRVLANCLIDYVYVQVDLQ